MKLKKNRTFTSNIFCVADSDVAATGRLPSMPIGDTKGGEVE